MIKKYELRCVNDGPTCDAWMSEDSEGEYILYSDFNVILKSIWDSGEEKHLAPNLTFEEWLEDTIKGAMNPP